MSEEDKKYLQEKHNKGLILNDDEVADTVPVLIPTTFVVADKVNVFPFADIAETLLKIGTVLFSSLNDIIESVLIPTLPEKLLFALVAAVPTTLITSDAEKYGNMRSYSTVSAKNVAIPVELDRS